VDRVDTTSGSDLELRFAFTDEAGDAVPVSAPEIILAEGALRGRITTVTDGAAGLVTAFIDGSVPMPVGVYGFRLRVTLSDGSTIASRGILIDVS
jgi:hypothetical protein